MVSSVEAVRREVRGFHRQFHHIKKSTIECLESCKIAITTVVFLLTSIHSVDEHKMFLEEKHKALCRCEDHWELFGVLNLHWNYLAYDLLDQLIEELTLKYDIILFVYRNVFEEMAEYKREIQKFRKRTTLKLFCQAMPHSVEDLPPGFRTRVIKHKWPNTITLEDVEVFRKCFLFTHDLRVCATMVSKFLQGSFTESAGPGYVTDQKTCVRVILFMITFYFRTTSTTNQSAIMPVYQFVEQPSDDFFCPVTFDLLLQPHLTSCCGKHLSQEAVTRIQREGGACPLCTTHQWSTMLSKYFQRQVNALHVFCHHKNKGCGWQGELSDLEHHLHSFHVRSPR